jgi:hypothetical protein
MHLDAESPFAGHPFVVVLSAGRVSHLRGLESGSGRDPVSLP